MLLETDEPTTAPPDSADSDFAEDPLEMLGEGEPLRTGLRERVVGSILGLIAFAIVILGGSAVVALTLYVLLGALFAAAFSGFGGP